MRYAALLVLLVVCSAVVCGCGSSSNGESLFTVRVLDEQLDVKTTTILAGDTVQWLNSSGRDIQIVSGTLQSQGNPSVIRLVSISNTGFNPTELTALLGDTIRFANNSFIPYTLEIVNDSGQIISRIDLPVGNQLDFPFTSAGFYTIRSEANPLFAANLFLYGQPNSNGIFESPVLPHSGVYTRKFTQPGTYNYFVLEQDNPNKSFITGTVIVQ